MANKIYSYETYDDEIKALDPRLKNAHNWCASTEQQIDEIKQKVNGKEWIYDREDKVRHLQKRLKNLEHQMSRGEFYVDDYPDNPKWIYDGYCPYATLNFIGGNSYQPTSTNLFNAYALLLPLGSSTDNRQIKVLNNGKRIEVPRVPGSTGGGSPVITPPFKFLCPSLKVGDVAVFSFTTTSSAKYIYLSGAGTIVYSGTAITITQKILNGFMYLYTSATNSNSTKIILTDFRVNLEAVTDFEPYIDNLNKPLSTYTIYGSNWFDASRIQSEYIEVSKNGQLITILPQASGNGQTSTNMTLGQLCPHVKPGDTLMYDFTTTGTRSIYLSGINFEWAPNRQIGIGQAELDSEVVFYGRNISNNQMGKVHITDLRFNNSPSVRPFAIYKEPQEYSLPEQVTALPDWGAGLGEHQNVYEFDSNNYTKKCLRYVFTGDETLPWAFARNTNSIWRVYLRPAESGFPRFIEDKGLCNCFTLGTYANRSSGQVGDFFVGGDGTIVFTISNDMYNAGWENFLKTMAQNGTPLTVVVQLLQPVSEFGPGVEPPILDVQDAHYVCFGDGINDQPQNSITLLYKQ